jgi:hypothetical protein
MPPPEIVVEPRLPDDEPEQPAKASALDRFLKIMALLLLAFVAWSAWAAVALYDLTSGLQDADPVALERRIDWAGVRIGLRDDLQTKLAMNADGPVAAAMARLDPPVDALLSRTAVINLLRTAKLNRRGWDTAANASGGQSFEWKRIQYAFFTGRPFALRIDVRATGDNIRRPLILLFHWAGDWRLTRVFLPADAAIVPPPQRAQPAVSSAAPEPPAPPAPPLPPGMERAALYEEDAANPQGNLHNGWVAWRTEQFAAEQGHASELGVAAQITIPGRALKLALSIRRNLDKALPASHVIEMKVDVPPDSPTGGVKDVLGIMMKQSEEAAGPNLAGSRVRVSNQLYMIGLSAIELDVQHNIKMLQERPWLGVPIMYNNGSRAVLTIQKGSSGETAIAEALKRWAATAVSRSGGGQQ